MSKKERLTILFFSRNDIDNAIGLVNDIKDVADEIVLIDQSDKEEKRKLIDFKTKARIKKFKVYDCVALGYPEPLQAYAFTKCTNEWVLRLDTDERIPEALKRDIKGIISGTKLDGFAIKRYEYSGADGKSNFATWQVRLFKRSKTEYTGVLHEQPMAHGKLGKLEGDGYYISHSKGLMNEELRKTPLARYGEISWIDQRLSYELYNQKVMEYIAKFFVISMDEARSSFIGKFVHSWMKFYESLFYKKGGSELSSLDYFFYYSLVDLGYAVQSKSLKRILKVPLVANSRLEGIKKLRKLPDAKVYFEISKIINKIGIIRFLRLDNPAVMEEITRKYRGKRHGVLLLIDLLKERYYQMQTGEDARLSFRTKD
ncbi:MAG: hypothetical protein LVQ95_01560 [Candidatus Micrarchaeales archaeon]|nr:hypothetical protein [Candidatus Micrarchaeales archaeon]